MIKSQHRPYSAFDIPMVLLSQVVQVLALPDSDDVFFWLVSVERGQRIGSYQLS